MERGILPRKTLLLWQIRVIIMTGCAVFLCIYYGRAFKFLNPCAFIISIFSLFLILWYLPRFFGGYEILFKNEAVIINYGVFMKFSHIMPYSRMIYAQSFATPLARLLKLSAVSLKAARSSVIVPEISSEDAVNIIDSLTGETIYDKKI